MDCGNGYPQRASALLDLGIRARGKRRKKSVYAVLDLREGGKVSSSAAEAAPSAVYNPGAGPLVPAPSTGGRAGEPTILVLLWQL